MSTLRNENVRSETSILDQRTREVRAARTYESAKDTEEMSESLDFSTGNVSPKLRRRINRIQGSYACGIHLTRLTGDGKSFRRCGCVNPFFQYNR